MDRIVDSARGDVDPELLTNSLSTGADSGYLIRPATEHIPSSEHVEFVFHNKRQHFKIVEEGGSETKVSGDEGWNIVVITGKSIHLLAGDVDGEDYVKRIRLKNVNEVNAETGWMQNKLILSLNESHEYSEIRIPVRRSDEVDEAADFIHMEPEKRELSQVGVPWWDSKKLYEVTPEEFESIIADLYRDNGYAARTTQSTNDENVDIVAESDEEKILVQAKRNKSSNRVGIAPVQRTAGLLSDNDWDPTSVVVATTAHFTDKAKKVANNTDGLDLLNGISLARKLQESNVPPERYGHN
jgi:hypothetical protein